MGPRRSLGTLAVADVTGGDEALAHGTIQIDDSCVLLDEQGELTLLVWPQSRTEWDAAAGVVVFTTTTGARVEVHHVDLVTLVGEGSSEAEDGFTADQFLDSVSWVSELDPGCVPESRWFVGLAPVYPTRPTVPAD